MSRGRHSGDEGVTLLELLIAIAVMGLAGTAMLDVLRLGMVSSEAHRRTADVETTARTYAELVKARALFPAATSLTAAVPEHAPGDKNIAIVVASAEAFPSSGTFGIAIDGEEYLVTAGAGTTSWKATAYGADTPEAGATVTRYEACPDASFFSDVQVPDLSAAVQEPRVIEVTLLDANGEAVVNCLPGLPTGDAYFTSEATVCGALSPVGHRTECDPPTARIALEVQSKETSGPSAHRTTTEILVRRPDA